MLKVLIAVGGSGGHLFPAQQLRELLKGNAEILFAGHKLGETPFFEREKAAFEEIAAAPLKRGFFSASWKGFWQSIRLIRRFRPDVVVGFGSFHAFPILLAAVFLRKKLVLFEANCSFGKVNRLFLPFAEKIAVQFALPRGKGVFVPLLPWVFPDSTVFSRNEAREYFQLSPDRLTLLIFGGSQGADFLNDVMPTAAAVLKERGYDIQVIHLSGKKEVRYSVPSCVKPFEKEMAKAYRAADIAICRAGAGTMAELIRFQVPALFIPFPYATEDHQRKNGEFLSHTVKGARLLLQKEATLERIVEEIEVLLKERENYVQSLAEYAFKNEKRTCFAELVRTVGGAL